MEEFNRLEKLEEEAESKKLMSKELEGDEDQAEGTEEESEPAPLIRQNSGPDSIELASFSMINLVKKMSRSFRC